MDENNKCVLTVDFDGILQWPINNNEDLNNNIFCVDLC